MMHSVQHQEQFRHQRPRVQNNTGSTRPLPCQPEMQQHRTLYLATAVLGWTMVPAHELLAAISLALSSTALVSGALAREAQALSWGGQRRACRLASSRNSCG